MESLLREHPDKAEALRIVRNILKRRVDPERIKYGNAKSYFPILFDGLGRQPICRVYFKKKIFVGMISTRKVETIVALKSLSELDRYSDDMISVVTKYMDRTDT